MAKVLLAGRGGDHVMVDAIVVEGKIQKSNWPEGAGLIAYGEEDKLAVIQDRRENRKGPGVRNAEKRAARSAGKTLTNANATTARRK